MKRLTRPTPVIYDERGRGMYEGAELAAWRASQGVTQEEVAARIHTYKPNVSRWESQQWVGEDAAHRLLGAIEFYAAMRRRMIADGTARLDDIRAERRVEDAILSRPFEGSSEEEVIAAVIQPGIDEERARGLFQRLVDDGAIERTAGGTYSLAPAHIERTRRETEQEGS